MLADFRAEVEVSDRNKEHQQARVALKDDQLIIVTKETKRSISIGDIFDIAQDVSSHSIHDSIETVTIAFKIGESREVLSIRRKSKTLFQFQQLLFRTLLNETPTIVSHTVGGTQKLSPTKLKLSITSPRIRLYDEGKSLTVVVPREQLTDFRTGEGSIGSDQQPVVTLYWVDDDQPAKTALCLPTHRLFNLFGRYIQSAIRLDSGDQKDRQVSVDVLLVDDTPHDLEMAELFLKRQSERFSIACTTSAAGGLEYLADDNTIDCVVSDYDMPGTNGIEFLQQVRQRYPDLPFVLFTGQGSEAIAKQAILDDVTDYVEKGVGTDQYALLAERIWKAIG